MYLTPVSRVLEFFYILAHIMKSKGITSTKRTKHGGDLKPDCIIHVAFQKSLDKWRDKLCQCLEKAEKRNLRSLSFPVLGTGKVHIVFNFAGVI